MSGVNSMHGNRSDKKVMWGGAVLHCWCASIQKDHLHLLRSSFQMCCGWHQVESQMLQAKQCKSRLKLSKNASKRVPDDVRWLLHAASLGY